MSLEFPITLCLTNGPWLYECDPEKRLATLSTEIGIFLERLYRLTVKTRCRKESTAWSFVGGPDYGRRAEFLHAHGILMTPENCRVRETLEKSNVYGHEPQGICRAVIDMPLTDTTKAGWVSYTAVPLDQTIWYRIHRSLR